VVIVQIPHAVEVVTEVYQWGYGSFSPMRIQCFRPIVHHTSSPSSSRSEAWSQAQVPVNITQVAAGHNHFVGIDSSLGFVYTWGFGAVQHGHGTTEVSGYLSAPLLVESMMPENGGGRAVYASAAGDRTCIITETGDLYGWGFTDNMVPPLIMSLL
jgi:alpha-tubulin suppressor-like RCC1 family protein